MQDNVGPRRATSSNVPRFPLLYEGLAKPHQPRMRAAPVALLVMTRPNRVPGNEDFTALGCRLRARVRAGDPVFPLGTTGYAILLIGAGTTAARKVATRLTTALGTPVEVIARDQGETTEAALLRLGARIAPAAQYTPRLHPER